MTARKPTDAESDNSGVTDDRIDRHELLEIVRQRGGATIDGLAKRTGLSESDVRWMVIDLKEAGLVDVRTGFHAVRIEPADDIATDGGVMQSLVNAVGGEQPTVDLTEAQLFEVLNNERRRRLTRLFGGVYDDEELTFVRVGNLAETLARVEKDTDEPIDASDRRRCYISLIQTHLPVLDDYGVIEYFERAKKLRVTEDAMIVADVLCTVSDVCDGDEDTPTPLTDIDADQLDRRGDD